MKTANYKTKKFNSLNLANEFMATNPEWATLKVVERDTIYINKQITIWLAKVSDLGKSIN